MPQTLKVDVDEPGRRLILSSDVPVMPQALAAVIRGGVVLVCGLPLVAVLFAMRQSGVSTSRLVDLGVATLGNGLPRAGVLITGAFFAVGGVAFGIVALFIVSISLPRDVVFDGSAHDFSRIGSLEMVGETRRPRQSPPRYYCRIAANVTAAEQGSKAIDILSTESFDDTETPYALGLSLLTDLSAATGLPKVVTDFRKRGRQGSL